MNVVFMGVHTNEKSIVPVVVLIIVITYVNLKYYYYFFEAVVRRQKPLPRIEMTLLNKFVSI
jgi:hypothetical protein